QWGESLVWDDRRGRLYFVDCMANTIHWLEDHSEQLHTMSVPSMPTGLVPTEDGLLVVVLDDGLYFVDPDRSTVELLTRFPAEIAGRCNDLCADLDGNLITGKLNLGPAEGSAWWYSPAQGWRLLDPDISNTNGPAVAELDGAMTLIIGDTAAHYYAYPYEPGTGTVGTRRVFGDMTGLEGGPDGSTMDRDGGLWCALFGAGRIVRFTNNGLDRELPVPMANPTDVTFGGPGLDVLYVVSTAGSEDLAGSLLRIDGLDIVGRPEPRFRAQ
ncbi:MAG TPA: SMP-30/gluconolactonase/LRE family protein, partial [Acidimicrobiales bacterium]|nr:SMP-30/gluconolactonase/LRE family protein [Acidimicrobiales bacterium]